MRILALLLAAALAGHAADFYTGQAARVVIGQRTFTAQEVPQKADPDNEGSYIVEIASRELLGSAQGVAYAKGILVVVDSNILAGSPNNNRVLIYRNWPAQMPAPGTEFAPEPDTSRCPVCVGIPDVVLGQPDFESQKLESRDNKNFYFPVAAATDGTRLLVSDYNNNRILVWNSIPTSNYQPADVVIGQPDFTTGTPGTTQTKLRGPQGLWIDEQGRLWVADTGNYRVLMWKSIPTQNGAPADLVLGHPNFTTGKPPVTDLADTFKEAAADKLNSPTGVFVQGSQVFVADLGNNRVLIWNSIPTQNGQPADVVIGQKDMKSNAANNSAALCESNGTDEEGNPTYPARCGATLEFPRAVISDGQRLFIADGGNDRVLVFNRIPTENGAAADVVLGQPDDKVNLSNDSTESLRISSADSFRIPTSLAWDGTNLYVADLYNRRVVAYTGSALPLSRTAVRNAASIEIYATGIIAFSGEARKDDEITVTIGANEYKYKVKSNDNLERIVRGVTNAINAGTGDPKVIATPNYPVYAVVLTAREAGEPGNEVEFSAKIKPSDSTTFVSTSGSKLTGGQDAAKIAPYTLVSIFGENLSDQTASADLSQDQLPWELGGVQVYFDGIRSPLFYVSPGLINAWMPVEVADRTSVSAYVRTQRKDGSITFTNAVAVPIVPQNPGIFALEGLDPRPGVVLHASSYATGTVSVDGTARAGDTATVIIGEGDDAREYTYTVRGDEAAKGTVSLRGSVRTGDVFKVRINDETEYTYTAAEGDSLSSVAAGLVNAVNGGSGNSLVTASSETVELATASVKLTVSGSAREGDEFRVRINDAREYSYTTQAGDQLSNLAFGIAAAVNAGSGDPDVEASVETDSSGTVRLVFTARAPGEAGNNVQFAIRKLTEDTPTSIKPASGWLGGGKDPDLLFILTAKTAGEDGNAIPFAVTVSPVDSPTVLVASGATLSGGHKADSTTVDIRDALVDLINQDPEVRAEKSYYYSRIRLFARKPGPEGEGIKYSTRTAESANVILTALTEALCCANTEDAPVTEENPALPGQQIKVLATGLGLVNPEAAKDAMKNGRKYQGPAFNDPVEFVSSLSGGKTAHVLNAGLKPGTFGLYEVVLELNPELPTDRKTTLNISQSFYTSNTITYPLRRPGTEFEEPDLGDSGGEGVQSAGPARQTVQRRPAVPSRSSARR